MHSTLHRSPRYCARCTLLFRSQCYCTRCTLRSATVLVAQPSPAPQLSALTPGLRSCILTLPRKALEFCCEPLVLIVAVGPTARPPLQGAVLAQRQVRATNPAVSRRCLYSHYDMPARVKMIIYRNCAHLVHNYLIRRAGAQRSDHRNAVETKRVGRAGMQLDIERMLWGRHNSRFHCCCSVAPLYDQIVFQLGHGATPRLFAHLRRRRPGWVRPLL